MTLVITTPLDFRKHEFKTTFTNLWKNWAVPARNVPLSHVYSQNFHHDNSRRDEAHNRSSKIIVQNNCRKQNKSTTGFNDGINQKTWIFHIQKLARYSKIDFSETPPTRCFYLPTLIKNQARVSSENRWFRKNIFNESKATGQWFYTEAKDVRTKFQRSWEDYRDNLFL